MSEQKSKKRERQQTRNNRTTTGFRISDELWAVLQLVNDLKSEQLLRVLHTLGGAMVIKSSDVG